MRRLSGPGLKRLQRALLDAFRTKNDLEQMVRIALGVQLDQVAGGANLRQTVFNLIEWAEVQGRLDDLVAGACADREGNEALAAFARDMAQLLEPAEQEDPVGARTGEDAPGERRRPPSRAPLWWSLGALLIIGLGIAGRWYAQTRLEVLYAADWVLQGNEIAPVGRLDDDVQKRRWSSFRIERRGGRVLRLQRVNGRGAALSLEGDLLALPESTTESDVVSLVPRYDDGGTLIELQYRNRNDALIESRVFLDGGRRVWLRDASGLPRLQGEVAGFERELDASGRQVAERYVNAHGARRRSPEGIFGEHRQLGAQGLPIRVTLVSADGKPLARRHGEAIRSIAYDARGERVSVENFDADNARTLGQEDFHRRTWKRDADGNVVEETSYDARGQVAPDDGGVARRVSRYDGGVLVEVQNLGADGKLVPGKDGWARIELAWDARGREEERRFFRADGQPTPSLSGCARIARTWDEAGNELRRTCYGRDGLPGPSSEGYAHRELGWSKAGFVTEMRYLDAAGKPAIHKEGYARVERVVDERGHETRWAVFRADGQPGLYNGYSFLKREYNERGYQLSESYHGAHGEPVVRADWCVSILRMDYNEQGDEVRKSYFDPSDALTVAAKIGYAKRELEYDKSGNRVAEAYFGFKGQSMLGPDLCHRIELAYDEHGNVTDTTCLDEMRAPARDNRGVHRIHRTYDARGEPSAEEFHAEDGLLTLDTKEKWAKVTIEHDARGNTIEKQYLGTDGTKRTLSVHGSAGSRYKYDERGNQIEIVMIGYGNRPLSGRDGIARTKRSYDAWGRVVKEEYFDVDEQPAIGKDGWSRVEFEYNAHGKRTATAYHGIEGTILAKQGCFRVEESWDELNRLTQSDCLDTRRRPVPGWGKASRVAYGYDNAGRRVSVTYLDSNNRRVRNKTGISRISYELDEFGRVVKKWYFDEADRAAQDENGLAGVEYTLDSAGRALSVRRYAPDHTTKAPLLENRRRYDLRGNLVEEAIFDGEGHNIKSGAYHRIEWAYDELGRKIEEKYFDEQNKPCTSEDGIERVIWKYDERSREIERWHTRADGSPMENNDGVSSFRNQYDALDRLTEQRVYGADGQLKAHPQGHARRTVTYDARGNPEETAYYDADDKRVRGAAGYAIERRKYFRQGPMREISFHDEENRLVVASAGFARMTLRYDANSKKIEHSFFDAGEELLPSMVVAFIDSAHSLKGKTGKPVNVVVTKIAPRSAADRAGLLVGDVLIEVGGQSIGAGMTKENQLSLPTQTAPAARNRVKVLRLEFGAVTERIFDIHGDLSDLRVTEAVAIVPYPDPE